jgi:hypothetical protein
MSSQSLNARNGLSVGTTPIQAIDASNNHTVANLTVTGVTTGIAVAAFPSGTVMPFYQATAPTSWTKVVTANDAVMRIVSGTTGGTGGGSQAFSTWNSQTATSAHTLVASELPVTAYTDSGHGHITTAYAEYLTFNSGSSPTGYKVPYSRGGDGIDAFSAATASASITNSSGGGSHTHPLSHGVYYNDFIIASKN